MQNFVSATWQGAWMAKGKVDVPEFARAEILCDLQYVRAQAAKVEIICDENPDEECGLNHSFFASLMVERKKLSTTVYGHPESALTSEETRKV